MGIGPSAAPRHPEGGKTTEENLQQKGNDMAGKDFVRMLAWIRENGGYIHEGLEIIEKESNERLVVIKRGGGVRGTEDLFRIPTGIMMLYDDAKKNCSIASIILSPPPHDPKSKHKSLTQNPTVSRPNSYALLSCYLLEERNKGYKSRFYPYICTLPRDIPEISRYALDYVRDSKTEESKGKKEKSSKMSALVLGDVLGDTLAGLGLRRFWRNILEEYSEIENIPGKPKWLNENNFSWARFIISSRIFRIKWENDGSNQRAGGDSTLPKRGRHLDNEDKDMTLAMVPLADMLNHSEPPNAFWSPNILPTSTLSRISGGLRGFRVSKGYFKMAAGASGIDLDSEATDSYGKKSNHILLPHYGFVLPNNPLDATFLTIPLKLFENLRKSQNPGDSDGDGNPRDSEEKPGNLWDSKGSTKNPRDFKEKTGIEISSAAVNLIRKRLLGHRKDTTSILSFAPKATPDDREKPENSGDFSTLISFARISCASREEVLRLSGVSRILPLLSRQEIVRLKGDFSSLTTTISKVEFLGVENECAALEGICKALQVRIGRLHVYQDVKNLDIPDSVKSICKAVLCSERNILKNALKLLTEVLGILSGLHCKGDISEGGELRKLAMTTKIPGTMFETYLLDLIRTSSSSL
ncbi:hypothetical protein AAMO2058_001021200 [Amorphochlora amoebiformis]